MTSNIKVDEKLEGVDNFRAWKYRVMLILEENDLEGFVKEEVLEPEAIEAKSKHKVKQDHRKTILTLAHLFPGPVLQFLQFLKIRGFCIKF
jgi:hypothetical protein